jgi:hypothetical protein
VIPIDHHNKNNNTQYYGSLLWKVETDPPPREKEAATAEDEKGVAITTTVIPTASDHCGSDPSTGDDRVVRPPLSATGRVDERFLLTEINGESNHFVEIDPTERCHCGKFLQSNSRAEW